LTTLFGDSGITNAAPIDARPGRKKLGWLPLLTVLFCVSYGLMTMLIVEQGSTIESQRVLIRELFRDSAELTATKLKAQREKNALAQHAQAPAAEAPSTQSQAPSTQVPSNQVPSNQNQAPSSQAAPRRGHASAQKPAPQQMPSRPAADLVDARRALITI
jgi:predicted lipid-binding transport protein (Tim44 family)